MRRNLKKYYVEILDYHHKDGLNSAQIAEILAEKYEEITAKDDRAIRFILDNGSEKYTPAKVLIFDIETAPLRTWAWSIWKASYSYANVERDWFMLTWSAKWLFDTEVMSDKCTPDEISREDDRRITESIWKLMDEADIVIAHNGLKFDIRKLNTRFLIHNLNNPSPYQVIDTLRHARKHLSFTSNRLDALGEILGLGRKIHTDFELWLRCMRGDQEAINEMSLYNDQDVVLLEAVYLRLRPFIKPHPNMGLFIGEDVRVCATCGAGENKLQWLGNDYVTYANRYTAFRCGNCGSIGRSRESSTPKSNKRQLLISLPK